MIDAIEKVGPNRRRIVRELNATRDRDTVVGVIAATEKEFGYEIIDLGESLTVELDRLIELLEQAMGVKAEINRQPAQPGDVPITFANIEKAQRLLGYNPQVKIEDGIPRFIEWFRRQNP